MAQKYVVADEKTGIIRCEQCGQERKSKPYTGDITNLFILREELDDMAQRHAEIHGWTMSNELADISEKITNTVAGQTSARFGNRA